MPRESQQRSGLRPVLDDGDSGYNDEIVASEGSPLLPTDLPPDIVPSKSFQRHVILMCVLFLFIVEIGQFIMEAPRQKIMEDVICRTYYPDHSLKTPQIQDHRCKNNKVQEMLAMVRGWSFALEMTMPIFAQFPYGIIADKYGRRIVLFLAVLGCVLQNAWVMIVLLFPDVFSIWAMLPGSLFLLIGGGGTMAAAMIWTILADVVPVAERTSTFFQLVATMLVLQVLVNPLSAFMLKFDPWMAMWLSFGCFLVGLCSVALIPETLVLRRKADARRRYTRVAASDNEQAINEENERDSTEVNLRSFSSVKAFRQQVLAKAWFTVTNDMKHVWRFIFSSKSIVVLILAIATLLPIRLAMINILLQYMTKRFDWEWSTATLLSNAGNLAALTSLLLLLPLGSMILTKRFHYEPIFKDLTLARISSVFVLTGMFMMTWAPVPWLFITSLVITSLGNGYGALCRAILNAIVEPHTVATLNTTIGLAEMLMALVSGPSMAWLLTQEDDDDESGDVDIENKYYNAKQLKQSDPEDAVAEFLAIPSLEDEKGEWGFKGLKQAIKLEYKLGQFDKAAEHYAELLTYVRSAVTRNYSEKSINNMLDYIEKGVDGPEAIRCMEQFYSLTLDSLKSTNNERLWLKTNIKLAKLLLDRKEYSAVSKKLRELHKSCQLADGSDDPSKGTYSLEIYALEIQMFAETKNNKQLKLLYQRALKVKSAVPHPRIMGIIRECGGKMHMSEENWKEAQSDFFESFRNYDEAGSLQRIQVLKYLLLTTMLMKSTINPFDSQETKPYKTDPRISAMTELVDAYQRDDVHAYEKVMQRNQDILDDTFIAENIDEVTRNMRTKGVVKLIAPYTRMKLAWIAKQLKIPEPEVQDILSFLIVDGKISGNINQQDGTLEITSSADNERVEALQGLTQSISDLFTTIFRDGDGFRSSDHIAEGQGVELQVTQSSSKGLGTRRALREGKKHKGQGSGWT
ncbi:COP9 signalosome complex subunit 2 [Mariannaea sp. PMI_226]|nr:COP9 signalosome complex subunit 2 [Mariannaea sp. PMI_226]